MGEQPEPTSKEQNPAALLSHGFNSPFEEFSIALDLARKGIAVTYPRAIYMSGLESSRARFYIVDERRFRALEGIVVEDSKTLFLHTHNYLTIWGYWNGAAEMEENHLRPIDLARACKFGMVEDHIANTIVVNTKKLLEKAGYRDLSFLASHLLLSQRHDKSLILGPDSLPAVRLCNFELMQPLKNPESLLELQDPGEAIHFTD